MLNAISKHWQGYKAAATLTIAAPGAGRYNTLQAIAAVNSATATIAICSPSTTTVIYSLKNSGVGSINQSFPIGAGVRGVENKPLYVKSSAGTYKLSATGIVEG